jgi:hypothetical protein
MDKGLTRTQFGWRLAMSSLFKSINEAPEQIATHTLAFKHTPLLAQRRPSR